jgi:hypothetical protein
MLLLPQLFVKYRQCDPHTLHDVLSKVESCNLLLVFLLSSELVHRYESEKVRVHDMRHKA